MDECQIPDCGKPHLARGYCAKHYSRQRRNGRLDLRSAEERFWAKVDRTAGPDACWPWIGSRTRQGYGNFRDGKATRAPRWILGQMRSAPLTQDEYACHHCDNPPCVNPAHLYVGTRISNSDDKVARGRQSRAGGRARKEHCPKGHPFDEANTYWTRHGSPQCRECGREANRRSYERRQLKWRNRASR